MNQRTVMLTLAAFVSLSVLFLIFWSHDRKNSSPKRISVADALDAAGEEFFVHSALSEGTMLPIEERQLLFRFDQSAQNGHIALLLAELENAAGGDLSDVISSWTINIIDVGSGGKLNKLKSISGLPPRTVNVASVDQDTLLLTIDAQIDSTSDTRFYHLDKLSISTGDISRVISGQQGQGDVVFSNEQNLIVLNQTPSPTWRIQQFNWRGEMERSYTWDLFFGDGYGPTADELGTRSIGPNRRDFRQRPNYNQLTVLIMSHDIQTGSQKFITLLTFDLHSFSFIQTDERLIEFMETHNPASHAWRPCGEEIVFQDRDTNNFISYNLVTAQSTIKHASARTAIVRADPDQLIVESTRFVSEDERRQAGIEPIRTHNRPFLIPF